MSRWLTLLLLIRLPQPTISNQGFEAGYCNMDLLTTSQIVVSISGVGFINGYLLESIRTFVGTTPYSVDTYHAIALMEDACHESKSKQHNAMQL